MLKNVWSNMYNCANILLTKNAFEDVDLEDELVQNQLHIAGRLTPGQCISPLTIDFNWAASE